MNVKNFPLQKYGDERGLLIAIEEQKDIPFSIKRIYYIFDTLKGVRRGFHAHKVTRQVAIVGRGSCKFLMDDGHQKVNVELQESSQGLLIEPLIWHEMYDFSDDCVLMVIADDFYNESDYIRDYNDFLKMISKDDNTQIK